MAGPGRMARLRAEGGRGARSRDDRRGDGRASGSRLRLHARQRLGGQGRVGRSLGTSEGVPLAIGPCVVTADECDPQSMFLQAKVEGEEMAKGNLNGAARSLFAMIAAASRGATLERADAFALGPFPRKDDDPGRRLWPGRRWSSPPKGSGPSEPAGRASVAGRSRALPLLLGLPSGRALGSLPLVTVLLLPPAVVRPRTLARSPRPMSSLLRVPLSVPRRRRARAPRCACGRRRSRSGTRRARRPPPDGGSPRSSCHPVR